MSKNTRICVYVESVRERDRKVFSLRQDRGDYTYL